eukprot:TRINITY_DN4918_c0_g1_i1.p1 TRINITY_DN4918_c0_g1~~TRINITY_DN4918_c0_g1_i1.p1  ORF type:complete len:551 (+),score=75.65 TRINITY_DN4918_c0_g1_i1:42-1655(+)
MQLLGFGDFDSGDGSTTVSHDSFCERMGKACIGVLIGIVMFIASFPVIIWNEGRSVYTAKALAEGRAAVVESECTPQPENDLRLVHISCPLGNLQNFQDVEFGIYVDGVWLKRSVEMFQWKETKSTKTTKDKVGGGSTTTTTYSYSTGWYSTMIRSNSFNQPSHSNPTSWPIDSNTFPSAASVTAGNFTLSSELIAMITSSKAVPVVDDGVYVPDANRPPSKVTLQNTQPGLDGWIYTGSTDSAVVGDMRLKWTTNSATEVSVIAQQTGSTFQKWASQYNPSYGVLLLSEHYASADAMFTEAENANVVLTWILRFVGFILMWLGMQLVTGPIALMPDLIPCIGPMIGDMVGCLLCCATCMVATTLSLLVIAIGWLAYRPAIGVPCLVVALLGIGGLVYLVIHTKGRRSKLKGGNKGDEMKEAFFAPVAVTAAEPQPYGQPPMMAQPPQPPQYGNYPVAPPQPYGAPMGMNPGYPPMPIMGQQPAAWYPPPPQPVGYPQAYPTDPSMAPPAYPPPAGIPPAPYPSQQPVPYAVAQTPM